MRTLRVLLVATILALGALVALRYVPPEWDPREPLDLRAAPVWMTRVKLARLQLQPEACFAAFAASNIAVTRVPDQPSSIGCAVQDAIRLPDVTRTTPRSSLATCRLAAAWVMFDLHVVQPAARQHFGTEITAFRHLGTHSCRNVNHASQGRRSEHATADAIDLASFSLRDGREVSVAHDWGANTPAGQFLRQVRDGACVWFQGVLGPDYNAAHANHFHLDMGRWQACR